MNAVDAIAYRHGLTRLSIVFLALHFVSLPLAAQESNLQTEGALAAATKRPRLVLDADTANEIDDMYAIVRMAVQDKYEVLGLNSAQWLHYLGQSDSVGASQKINDELVALLPVQWPTFMGAAQPVGKPWGGDDPKDSPAAQFIIQSVRETPAPDRLTVVCIGATTNLATAIKLAPDIAPRIDAYCMGFRYDSEKSVWNKSEFNVRRDLNAADFLLNQSDLELHIMSATTSEIYKFDRDDTFERLSRMGALGKYLTLKWKARFADSTRWVMWDLALIEAMLHPEMAVQRQVMTPPENTQRKVWMYTSIDADAMREDFWKATEPLQK